ncbi:hypothetical protein [uncultured Brachyspira sp.]|uniref:hypothetical protein n=1 Tax=uncultured Brachyspira sp. TaxID=221953 RepID=UPI00261FB532|nr:hypothetical protein [uncultured Brachyspira sp.]
MALTVREFIKKLEEIKDKDSIVVIGKAESKSTGKSTVYVMEKGEYDYDIVTSEDYLKTSIVFFDKDIEEKNKI